MDPFSLADIASRIDLGACTDAELIELAQTVADEQRRRALEAGDPEALVELGFAEGFTSAGMPRDPWLREGLLICPGAKIDRSGTSHDCGFVHVGEQWVWESPGLVLDIVRHLPGPRPVMRSVSVLAPVEGTELDLVVSKMRSGVHQMRSVRSFLFTGGELKLVSARARKADSHR